MKKLKTLPAGWSRARLGRVIRHYEQQTGAEAVAEDSAATSGKTLRVRDLIARESRKRHV